jgi:hypothetical protein
MRVTTYPTPAPPPTPAESCPLKDSWDQEWCRIAGGLDLTGNHIDTDFRANPTPAANRQLIYAGDFMSGPGYFLTPGETDTFQRVVDIDSRTVGQARLSVSAVFITERRIKDTRSCDPEYYSLTSPIPSLAGGHFLCVEYEIAPSNIVNQLVGPHQVVLRVFMITDAQDMPGRVYPRIEFGYFTANQGDQLPDQRTVRKIMDANPTAEVDASTEYAPADPTPSSDKN